MNAMTIRATMITMTIMVTAMILVTTAMETMAAERIDARCAKGIRTKHRHIPKAAFHL